MRADVHVNRRQGDAQRRPAAVGIQEHAGFVGERQRAAEDVTHPWCVVERPGRVEHVNARHGHGPSEERRVRKRGHRQPLVAIECQHAEREGNVVLHDVGHEDGVPRPRELQGFQPDATPIVQDAFAVGRIQPEEIPPLVAPVAPAVDVVASAFHLRDGGPQVVVGPLEHVRR